jgi:hypothetical protein
MISNADLIISECTYEQLFVAMLTAMHISCVAGLYREYMTL